MKKIFFLIMLFCAFISTTSAEELPSKFDSVMNVWNASSAEELRVNICHYWMSINEHPNEYDPHYFPVKIRIGGTTQEIISDKKNWDMAIISSKDVDITQLIDEQLISISPYNPMTEIALYEWCLNESLKKYIPYVSPCMYDVYVYDYFPETDEAILIIEQDSRWRKRSSYINFSGTFILQIMQKRPAEQVRRLEKINCIYNWSAEELLNKSSEWDVALLENFPLEDIEMLDQAGILRAFDDVDYFVQRPAVIQRPNRESLTSRIYNENGSIVAIPYYTNGGNDYIMLINSQGCNISYSLRFAEHLAKSYEWFFQATTFKSYTAPNGKVFKGGVMIPREEVDW